MTVTITAKLKSTGYYVRITAYEVGESLSVGGEPPRRTVSLALASQAMTGTVAEEGQGIFADVHATHSAASFDAFGESKQFELCAAPENATAAQIWETLEARAKPIREWVASFSAWETEETREI